MGEIIHGEYSRWANDEMFDSVTNYQCYKGNFSAHNDRNYFEIAHNIEMGISLKRYLYNFLDNHDVPRLASVLRDSGHANCCYTMMYMMYGVPSVYYGSEWGIKGAKGTGAEADLPVRPELGLDDIEKGDMELMKHIAALGKIRLENSAIQSGKYSSLELKNQTFLFIREKDGAVVYIALNISDGDYTFNFTSKYATLTDLLSGIKFPVANGRSSITVPKNRSMVLAGPDSAGEISAAGGYSPASASKKQPVVSEEPAVASKETRADDEGPKTADRPDSETQSIAWMYEQLSKRDQAIIAELVRRLLPDNNAGA